MIFQVWGHVETGWLASTVWSGTILQIQAEILGHFVRAKRAVKQAA